MLPASGLHDRIHFGSSGTCFVALRYSSHSKRRQQVTVAESLAIPSSESMTAIVVLMVSIYFQSPPPPTPRRPSDGVSRTQAATLLVRSRLSGRGYLSLTHSPWDILTQSSRLWTDHQVASVLLCHHLCAVIPSAGPGPGPGSGRWWADAAGFPGPLTPQTAALTRWWEPRESAPVSFLLCEVFGALSKVTYLSFHPCAWEQAPLSSLSRQRLTGNKLF